MEENKTLKRVDQKLKKYISKSIYSEQLSECETLMTRNKLHLFYDQMQQHFYQQNAKKTDQERRHSLRNDKLFLLEERKNIRMDTQPQIHRISKNIKKRTKFQTTSQKHNKQNDSCLTANPKKCQNECEVSQNLKQFNFFVRKVKSPKVVRYISLKPDLELNKTQQLFNSPKSTNSGSSNKSLITSNFMERTSLFNKLKKQFKNNQRNPCLGF